MCNVCATTGWWAVPQTPVAKHGCQACHSTPIATVALLAQERALDQCDHLIVGMTSTEVDLTPLLSLVIDMSGSDFLTCVPAGCGCPSGTRHTFVQNFLVYMLYVLETVHCIHVWWSV